MKLIIVESPHKAQTISKYLGKDFRVVASAGHVRDLPEKRLGIDILNDFKPEYEIKADKTAIISKIKKDVEAADTVYLAGDPDREGEAISWHISQVFGLGNKNRIEFNEISEKAVKKALETPRDINMQLVDAQQARRVLDRIVGYELSPILSKKIQSGLSAGRVQSVALKMIVDREKEIRDFKPQEYWNINAFISKKGEENSFKSEYVTLNGKKHKVTSKEQADEVMNNSKAGLWQVKQVKRAKSISKTPAPFTTSTMQQDAITKLGMSASQVSKFAQSLYEGVEIQGMGQTALITYIRTDSVRVSEDAQKSALRYIEENYGKDYRPNKPNSYVTKESAQDAHEAIRPINIELSPAKLKDKMPKQEFRLYKLIYERFLASQMASAIYDTLNVTIESQKDENSYGYNLKGKTCVFKGYTAVYTQQDSKAQSDEVKQLPNFNEGDLIDLKDIKGEQKFTKPPQRYNDGTLIKGMEENGIGRPATYAKIVAVLDLRKYIERVDKYIQPTQLGETVCEQLEKDFPNIMNAKFTADMETNLDKIEEGEVKWFDVLKKFYPDFHKKVVEVKFDKSNSVSKPTIVIDEKCPECGEPLVVKQGRYGQFKACSNYPKCKFTKPMEEAAAKCPKCGKDVYKRLAKNGKTVYYACSGYPTCKFISWDVPAPILCPKCKSTMKVTRNLNTGVTKYTCTNKDCKNVVVPLVAEKIETKEQNSES